MKQSLIFKRHSSAVSANVIPWKRLNPDSLIYSHLAHLYYGGEDLVIEREEAVVFASEFINQVIAEGGYVELEDILEGINTITGCDGRISMMRLVEELCLLLT
ncbi:hypothetical protein THRCLA_11050 [Thraustotheca clavata]|uniref:Uncharacterized protein n=1 Tax=Thraustotheca clavata TaxID=74557 RepID=A0A1V9Y8Z8_9STRA|nr:hypothetical protein THRCLA_11050 [Thraustotheca clavata]